MNRSTRISDGADDSSRSSNGAELRQQHASPRRNTNATADNPQMAGEISGLISPLSTIDWAKGLINELSGQVSEEELAMLAAQAEALAVDMPVAVAPPDPTRPVIVRDRKALGDLAAAVAAADEVVVDLETSSLDPGKGVIVGIGLAVDIGTYYVPINHRFEDGNALRPGQLPLALVLDALRLQDKPLINHNAKFELRWLRHHGNLLCRFVRDTMIAARLLRSELLAELKEVAARELDIPDWDMSKADKKRIQYLPIEQVAGYCAKDCWYTLKLYRRQQSCLV